MARATSSAVPRWRQCVLLTTLLLGACADSTPDFSGIWKSNCRDYWGVRIQPSAAGLYSVSFCGLSGCMQAGQWMPDTGIVGDPMYEVVSDTRLRIKRKDAGAFTYTRCSPYPDWPPLHEKS